MVLSGLNYKSNNDSYKKKIKANKIHL
jgi:hypothetical protein